MVKRLSKAASNEQIKRGMDAEDSINRLINREIEEKLKKQAELYEERLQEIEKKLQENEREKEQLRRQLEEALRQLKK